MKEAFLVLTALLTVGPLIGVGMQSPATVSVAPPSIPAQALPLVQQANLTYVGGWNLPGDPIISSGGLAFNPPNGSNGPRGSVFVANGFVFAEVQIPTPAANADSTQMPAGTLLQEWTRVGGSLRWPNPGGVDGSAGVLLDGGRLIGAGFLGYDANASQVLSHFVINSTKLAGATASGPYQVWNCRPQPPGGLLVANCAGFVDGYFGLPNAAWAPLIGPAFTGQQAISIRSRTSNGPAIFSFDPSQLGVRVPAPATPLVYYPMTPSGLLAPWPDLQRCRGAASMNTYHQNADWRAGGIVMPAGSRSVLVFGRHGTGEYSYGPGTLNAGQYCVPIPGDTAGDTASYDPEELNKGEHGYPYAYYVWAFDANDLLAAKNGKKSPWAVTPYAVWTLTLPNLQPPPFQSTFFDGATIDPATNTIYTIQQGGAGSNVALIQVFSITVN